ncbi:uncharacterized protein [Dermacentor albipictus]|uniref:uncharacterized protein isoform X2 n=1 Tax=Dermacentor albipictus TaxID=60249 RepID=UPI0038FC6F45
MLRIKRRIASSRCCSSANGTRPNGVGSLRDLILHFPARGRSASASLTASSSQTLGPSVSRPRVRRCILDSCVLDPHRGSLMCKLAGTLRRPALAHRGSLVQARWDPPSAWVRRCILDRCVLYRHWIRTWRTVRLSPHPLQVGGSPPVKSSQNEHHAPGVFLQGKARTIHHDRKAGHTDHHQGSRCKY